MPTFRPLASIVVIALAAALAAGCTATGPRHGLAAPHASAVPMDEASIAAAYASTDDEKDGEADDAGEAPDAVALLIGTETAGWPRLVDPARGLVAQTARVDVTCFGSDLVEILADVETEFGAKPVVTSGFRNRGRRGSLHRTCRAADIQVPDVPRERLVAYLRTHPKAGGVGTYCHTKSVHVDTGTPRDWSYGCGRRGRTSFAMRLSAP